MASPVRREFPSKFERLFPAARQAAMAALTIGTTVAMDRHRPAAGFQEMNRQE